MVEHATSSVLAEGNWEYTFGLMIRAIYVF